MSRFFDQLGYVFKFVKDDVVQKLGILQQFVDRDTNGRFETIQKAIDYETANNLIKTNPENFARTLLRLHRALIFIEEFLRGLANRPPSDSTVAIATNAYDSTLYHHRKSESKFSFETMKMRFRWSYYSYDSESGISRVTITETTRRDSLSWSKI